jgi:hypothetical protein
MSIAVLPWVVASQGGIGLPGISRALPESSTAIESLTSVLVVASDRPTVSVSFRPTDGARVLWSTPAGRSFLLHPSGIVRLPWLSGPVERSEPLALHLAGRGPPVLLAT